MIDKRVVEWLSITLESYYTPTIINPFTARFGFNQTKLSSTFVNKKQPIFAVFTYRLVTVMRLELIRARVAPQ